jgi:NADH:ubiquinone oxidoreductase subunit H
MYTSFIGGWNCYLEVPGACPEHSHWTFWLLPGYCTVNFFYCTIGLFLTKYGGATISSISYSMLLPLSALSNALPLLGRFRETITIETIIGMFPTYHSYIVR